MTIIHHPMGRTTTELVASTVLGLLAATGCALAADTTEPRQPADAYITAFRRHLDLAEQDLPHIARLAEGTADQFIKNQTVKIAMNDHYFFSELTGRASGLTGIDGWSGEQTAAENQLLLIALDSTPDDRDAEQHWLNTAAQARGANVVLLANRTDLAAMNHPEAQRPFQPSDFYGFVDSHVPEGEFTYRMPGAGADANRAMLSSVINAMNGWLFTGELAAACTRRGEMPVFWLAFQVDIPRAFARNTLYSTTGKARGNQKRFHDDFTVPPVAAGTVGASYIAHLRSYLDRLERWPDLELAVRRIAAAIQRGKKVYFYGVGHMFPHVVARSQREHTMTVMDAHYFDLEKAILEAGQPGDVLFLLCMPAFEDKTVTSALEKGIEVIAMSTTQPPEAIQSHENLHWIAAPWPTADGCVEIPGYDIPVLAVSGVMHSVIYYAVRSQVDFELAVAGRQPVPAGE